MLLSGKKEAMLPHGILIFMTSLSLVPDLRGLDPPYWVPPQLEKGKLKEEKVKGDTTTDRAICPGSKGSFVPVLEPGFGCRDKLSRVVEPGQNVPHAKKIFASCGIRTQDLLPSAWLPYQLT